MIIDLHCVIRKLQSLRALILAPRKIFRKIIDLFTKADYILCFSPSKQAEAATARAEKAVSELKAEQERLHAVVDAYRNNFQKLLDEQLEALTASEALLK